MKLLRVHHRTAAEARGITIVIDVIRAFSVAGYAFERGARGIWLVRSVEEAQALQKLDTEALLAGEVKGHLIPGFQFNNSPSLMAQANAKGKQLIQRTGAGTQGAVNASNSSHILLCALTNAQATAQYAQWVAKKTGETIALFPTASYEQRDEQNEDDICADYVEALILKQTGAREQLTWDIASLHERKRFLSWESGDPDFPFDDIASVLDVDRFPFAMEGTAKQWQEITYVDARRIDLAPLS